MRRDRSRVQATIATALLVFSVLANGLPAVAQDGSEPDGSSGASPSLEQLQAAVDRLPDGPDDDDAAGLRLLLGPPDTFTISFAELDDGTVSRHETWVYFDLATAFEIVDGAIIWDVPLAEETTLLVSASRYDPDTFKADATWPSLAEVLPDAGSFVETELDEAYGVPATIIVGDQLVLAFDEDGALVFAESIALTPGADA